jgi:hypothetical protein
MGWPNQFAPDATTFQPKKQIIPEEISEEICARNPPAPNFHLISKGLMLFYTRSQTLNDLSAYMDAIPPLMKYRDSWR